jgi:hypothetical protein
MLTASANAGETTDWYAAASGGSALDQTTGTFTTPTLSSTTTYYVEARNTTTGCVSATRTAATVTINTPAVPSVTIASNASENTICSGESVTFTATATNGGNAPSYQWKLNDANVTGTGATYSNATLANNDVVSVVLTSNNNCVSSNTATSNGITTVVNDLPAPLTLTGSSYCATTSSGGTVVSGTSTIGVNYSLHSNGTIIDGPELSGTSAALTWSSVAAGTSYTVIGTNTTTICSSVASNAVAVTSSATNGAYVYYLDTDGDNYGTGTAVSGCSATTPAGYSVNTGDCNNTNNAIYPTAVELCGNGIDENCSGTSDDVSSFYRTRLDGNWGDASTWEAACTAQGTYVLAAAAPGTDFEGVVNIRDTHDVTIPANGTVYRTGTLDIDAGGSLTLTGNGFINSPTTGTVSPIAKLSVTVLIDNAGTLNIGHQASLVQTSTTASNTLQKRTDYMKTAVELSAQAGVLYTDGLAVEAIAKELSVTYRTARKAVAISGVTLRDPSERLKGRTRKSPLA